MKSSCTTQVDSILHKVVYLSPDKLPEPNEGYSAFSGTIFKQLKSNESFEEYTGKVVIAFVVEINGEIDGIRVLRDMPKTNHFFSNQIVKAIKNYKPKWKPGSCNGTLVPVLFMLPFQIDFQE